MFGASHLIVRLVKVLRDMEEITHDFGLWGRPPVGGSEFRPHAHAGGLDFLRCGRSDGVDDPMGSRRSDGTIRWRDDPMGSGRYLLLLGRCERRHT